VEAAPRTQKKGHTVAIASSATLYQIEPLAEDYGIEHIICTRVPGAQRA
jgi:putative phosphoserine phosphatase/1-acylglycerol-3-phosphate O-acyltransferase